MMAITLRESTEILILYVMLSFTKEMNINFLCDDRSSLVLLSSWKKCIIANHIEAAQRLRKFNPFLSTSRDMTSWE